MKIRVKLTLCIGLVLYLSVTTVVTQQNSTTTPSVPETTNWEIEPTTSPGGTVQLPIFPEDNPRIENGTDPAIILGQRAQQGEIPWQVYLFSQFPNRNDGAVCGGSLVHPIWVLTAAHCITDTRNTLVHLGSPNRNNMPYRQYANLRFFHEQYNPNNLNNDVALLRLPVAAEGNNIAVIQMAPRDWPDLDRVPVRASGFGLTRDGGQTVDDLMKVNLRVITNQQCRNAYGSSTVIASTLCATWTQQSGQSTCNGDSGGPLTAVANNRYYLVGVTSFVTRGDCDSGNPSGYARVSSFRDWIDSNMARNS